MQQQRGSVVSVVHAERDLGGEQVDPSALEFVQGTCSRHGQ
jgi:hypothetical protein